MKENGTMNWLAQIRQMKNRDIRTIEQHELQELPRDAVEHGLPQEERLKNLLDKVGNPYCYLDNGIIVKLNFVPRGAVHCLSALAGVFNRPAEKAENISASC